MVCRYGASAGYVVLSAIVRWLYLSGSASDSHLRGEAKEHSGGDFLRLQDLMIPEESYAHMKSGVTCYYCFDQRNNTDDAEEGDSKKRPGAEDAPARAGDEARGWGDHASAVIHSSTARYHYSAKLLQNAYTRKAVVPFFAGLRGDRWTRHRRQMNKIHCPPYVLQALGLFRNVTDYFVDLGGDLGDCSLAAFWQRLTKYGSFSVDGRAAAVRAWRRTVEHYAGRGADGGGTRPASKLEALGVTLPIWKKNNEQESLLRTRGSAWRSDWISEVGTESSVVGVDRRRGASGVANANGQVEHQLNRKPAATRNWWSVHFRSGPLSADTRDRQIETAFAVGGGTFVLGPATLDGARRQFPVLGTECGGFPLQYCHDQNACGETAMQFVGACPVDRWPKCGAPAAASRGKIENQIHTSVEQRDDVDDCAEVATVASIVKRIAAEDEERRREHSTTTTVSSRDPGRSSGPQRLLSFGLRVKLTGSDVYPVLRDLPDELLRCADETKPMTTQRTPTSCIRWLSVEDVFTRAESGDRHIMQKLFVEHDFAILRFRPQRTRLALFDGSVCNPYHDPVKCGVRDVLAVNCASSPSKSSERASRTPSEASRALSKNWDLIVSAEKVVAEDALLQNATALRRMGWRRAIQEEKVRSFVRRCLDQFPSLERLASLEFEGIKSFVPAHSRTKNSFLSFASIPFVAVPAGF